MPIEILKRVTTLLKSLSSSAVTFATADNSIAATGIGTTFTAGKKIVVSGAAESANNTTFTVASVSSANKIIVTETVTAEAPGASVVINEEEQSGWVEVHHMTDVVGVAYCSQNAKVFLDFSNDKTNTDITIEIDVSAGVAQAINQPVIAHEAQLRVRNDGTDQTELRVYINGKYGRN